MSPPPTIDEPPIGPDDRVEDIAADLKPRKTRRLTRRRILLWLTLIFVGTVILGATVIYVERLSVVERVFRSALAERGLDADMEVERLSLTELALSDVVLKERGRTVLKAKSVVAGYNWQEALDGTIRSITIDGATIRVGMDEDFKLTDGWLQPSGDGAPAILPYEGVTLTDSELDLDTPYGAFDISLAGRIDAVDRFALSYALPRSKLDYNDITASFAASGRAARDGDTLTLDLDMPINNVATPDISAKDGQLTFDGDLTISTLTTTGPIAASFASADTPFGRAEGITYSGTPRLDLKSRTYNGDLALSLDSLDGDPLTATLLSIASPNLSFDLADPLAASGPLTLTADTASAFDMTTRGLSLDGALNGDQTGTAKITADRFAFAPARARDLAASLSLSELLSAAPVTRDYSAGLTEQVRQTLAGGRLSTEIEFSLDPTGRTIDLLAPATLSGANTVRLTPVADQPAYRFTDGELTLALNASLTGSRALSFSNLNLRAASENGLALDAVRAFSGRLKTGDWTATTPDGRTTNLAALTANIRSTPSRTVLSGPFTFTGDIPGGYVTNLRTEGELTLTRGDRLTTNFLTDTPLTFDRLLLPSGARVNNFSGRLTSSDPVFIGDGTDADILATLADASFTYAFELEDGTAEVVDITADTIEAEGQIDGTIQDWALQLTTAKINSDTFIGEGTTASAPDVSLTARLDPTAPLAFTLDTDALTASTVLASVKDMPVSADGNLEDFEVTYGPGKIKSPNPSVPVTTVEGTAIFRGGDWVGEARATLPGKVAGVQLVPLDVQFQFRDGAGTADVIIEDLLFDPDGGLQPQDYVPALRGKIAEVAGTVDGRFTLTFGVDQPLDGSGEITLNGLNMGTAPGPVTGLFTTVAIDSLFPLKTKGRQTLTLERFDPGLPLENGTIEYELIPEGIKIYDAAWPLGDGEIRLEPLTWVYLAELNRAVLVLDGVSLQAFLDKFGQERIKISGILQGRLPVEIRGVNVEIRNGRLDVPTGGTIQYETPQTDTAAAQTELTQMAFDALRDFPYRRLGLSIDGPLDGEVTIDLGFVGRIDPDQAKLPLPKYVKLDEAIPFEFDVSITGELFNILRSFDPNKYSQEALDEARQQLLESQGFLPENTE